MLKLTLNYNILTSLLEKQSFKDDKVFFKSLMDKYV